MNFTRILRVKLPSYCIISFLRSANSTLFNLLIIIISTVNNSTTDFATILNRAATDSARPSRSELVAALQAAEITARNQKLAIPFASLLGEWRLCFATGASKPKKGSAVKLGRGYYLPKFTPASITFTRDDNTCDYWDGYQSTFSRYCKI